MIELMRVNTKISGSNIKNVFDGTREGDAVADIRTPTFEKGMRIYMSIKKSLDTVGGQDIPGVIKRLEDVAKEEKNLTSPYLCVFGIATPNKGKLKTYEEARKMKTKRDGDLYSYNCEVWMPGFLYPYITGHEPQVIFKKSIEVVRDYLPFYTLEVREEAIQILKSFFVENGIADEDGNIDKYNFFEYIVS